MGDFVRQGSDPLGHGDNAQLVSSDQRIAPRVGVLIRPAKLLTPQGEFLCVIRDVSETGVSARIFHKLPDCEEVVLELQNGDQYAASLIWQDQGKAGLEANFRAGFRFANTADLAQLVASPSRYAKRPIRLNIEGEAAVVTGGKELSVTLRDISGQGAKIAYDDLLPLDAAVVLRADGLRETWAKVRWRRNGQYGLVFEDTLQMSELALTVKDIQEKMRNCA